MSILGVGQGQVQPAQGDLPNAETTQIAAIRRSSAIVSSSSPATAESLGSKRNQFDNDRGNGSHIGSKFGRQALNTTGRGQIVNIIV